MSQLRLQYKYKLTGSSVKKFEHKKKKNKLSLADRLFMTAGILFVFYLLIASI
ncbi:MULTISPECIES: TetR family transcriptional regulator [Providencia]|uniref:TetR family transcriptional regulator n=1 Tax=Providencia TaxID=586 RepID=UPI000DE6B758|nr:MULTISPECIES: TetR family transcriptional regulator [Providencia]SST02796.1 Uncharacterised protein [Acinetobacter baumannii]MDQ5989808.1 TetR family transcriptional regulator [Providencia stuartii]MDT7048727.1 TetR family transcriptional regulator [Providencia stuartii]QIC16458.1 TetR family transcriptional regulator [Providencia vermicola]RMA08734.1 TetR family transcriptional regulator [Providencia stuartii]